MRGGERSNALKQFVGIPRDEPLILRRASLPARARAGAQELSACLGECADRLEELPLAELARLILDALDVQRPFQFSGSLPPGSR